MANLQNNMQYNQLPQLSSLQFNEEPDDFPSLALRPHHADTLWGNFNQPHMPPELQIPTPDTAHLATQYASYYVGRIILHARAAASRYAMARPSDVSVAPADAVTHALAAYANAMDAEHAVNAARLHNAATNRHATAAIATDDINVSMCHVNAAVAAAFAVEASYQIAAAVAPNLPGAANFNDPDAIQRRAASNTARQNASDAANAYIIADAAAADADLLARMEE